MADRSLQFLRGVPPALKEAIASQATREGGNMNSVCVAILADAYQVEVEPDAPRKTTPKPDGTDMMLRIASGDLRAAIRFAAARRDWSVPREIIHTLCLHFGLDAPERPPVDAATAAA